MITVAEYNNRYEDFNDWDYYYFETDKLIRFVISDLEQYLEDYKEYDKWKDLDDRDKHLLCFDIYQDPYKYNIFHVEASPFSVWEAYDTMVSDQVKCFRLRYNDIRVGLIKSGLEKCIKVSLVFKPKFNNLEIKKNQYYHEELYPYKYYTNKMPVIKYTIDINKIPEEYLGLVRIYGVDLNSVKKDITTKRNIF